MHLEGEVRFQEGVQLVGGVHLQEGVQLVREVPSVVVRVHRVQ